MTIFEVFSNKTKVNRTVLDFTDLDVDSRKLLPHIYKFAFTNTK